MHRTLIVTNDFPPRPGGIQAFVHNMAVRQPAGSVVVYASTWRDGTEVRRFDAEQPFPVIRDRTKVMVPTPAGPPRSCGRRSANRSGSAPPPRSA